ncbi:PAS domain S-box protein [Geobacter sp. AOG2]|uniref:PAS domain S-box protein n=1 Tax=Geobacter sp. AOG2 TaxID=1566347 RepID=UPI001CC47A68|nr:PAS domain S-box protein [Geobacter sp. AOG2]GFE60577.1 hypothetical protein AOG2_11650 [Geobacter sp. AOG2]
MNFRTRSWWFIVLITVSALTGTGGASQSTKSSKGMLILTPEENAWLAAHPVVRVRISRTYPPFEFFDQGHFQGMAYDHLMLIGKQLGIEFRPEPDMSWKDALESLKNKSGVDLALMITHDKNRESFIEFTKNYISFPQVIFTRKNSKFISNIKDLSGGVIATENDFIEAAKIRHDVPEVKVIETPTTATSLEAVATGKADAYVGNLAVASYLIEKKGLVNLKVVAPSPYPEDAYAMGVRKDWPELARILDKALMSIPAEEHRGIEQKWLSLRYEHGIRPRDVIKWALAVAGIALAFIVQLRRMVRNRTIELEHEIETRKRTEDSLRQREAELQSLYMAAPVGIAYVKDRIFLKVNDAMCAMYGFTREELIGQKTRIIYASEEDFETVGSDIYAKAMVNDATMLEIQGVTKLGYRLDVLVGIAPLVRGDTSAGFVVMVLDVTERIKAVKALKESEKRFQTIFDENPLSIFLHEIETGEFVDVNHRCCELHGISKELAIGKRADELGIMSKAEFQRFNKIFIETGSIDQEEMACVDFKGNLVSMLISARAIEISGKQYGITMSQDITEKRRAEENLSRSEEKYRNIFENAPIGIFQSLPSGQFITVNTVYAHIFGYETAEDMIAGVPDIPHQLYAQPRQREKILRQLEVSDLVVCEELEAIRKDGSHFYANLYMRAMRNEQGKVEVLEGFLSDDTQRKLIKDELVDREERMRLYIERLPIACIVFDKDYTVQSWNPAAERTFGYSPEEAAGRKATELIVPPSARPLVDQVWQRLPAGDLEATGTSENVTKDGRTILCEWTNTPLRDAKGEVSGVISIAQDITEWKLAQEMMIQNEKMTMIGCLAAGLAHEINNPVGIVVQAIQIMERRLSPELVVNTRVAEEVGVDLGMVRNYLERREIFNFITSMKEAGKRATKIIKNMLQFAHKSDSWNQLSNLPDVIEQAIEMSESDYDLRRKYDIRNVKIIRNYENNLPRILINITEIEQVLINLIKNSAQAMCEDDAVEDPTIRISVSRDGETLVIKLADNGPGMTNDVKKRIFEPFYTTKEVGVGTGLGLAVSYMLITNNHRGSIEVESSPGEGTCFTIKLPLVNQLKGAP